MNSLYETGGVPPLPPHLQDAQRKCGACGNMFVGSTISPCPQCVGAVKGPVLGGIPQERRALDDKSWFGNYAAWLQKHKITEERRKPRNIVNECNKPDEPDFCPDCGSEGNCLAGCPSRL